MEKQFDLIVVAFQDLYRGVCLYTIPTKEEFGGNTMLLLADIRNKRQ